MTPTTPTGQPTGRLPDGFDGPRACGPFDLAPALDMINLVFRTQPAADFKAIDVGKVHIEENQLGAQFTHNSQSVLAGTSFSYGVPCLFQDPAAGVTSRRIIVDV